MAGHWQVNVKHKLLTTKTGNGQTGNIKKMHVMDEPYSPLDESRPINLPLSSVEGIITRRLIAQFANKATLSWRLYLGCLEFCT